jgi:aryl-alcohol dehydrogenase-like predicted oxidoreductase
VYLLHQPDDATPIEDTLSAMTRLVDDGKVREIGCSNFSGPQIDEAMAASQSKGLARFVSAQNHYNLLERSPEAEVIPACERHGLGMLPYFPLANGMLTGKYRRGQDPPEGTRMSRMPGEQKEWLLSDRHFDIVEKLSAFAAERAHTLLELAFSWLASQPTVVSVIAGATKPEQIEANATAAQWQLSKEELAQVDSITSA